MRHFVRIIPFLAIALLFAAAPKATAQSVYGFSSIDIGPYYVTSDSETDLDYYAEMYYYAGTDAYLWAGSSTAASGSSSGSVTLETSTSVNTTYYIQTNHWIDTESGSPYCFSCAVSPGWYSGSLSVFAASAEEGEDYGAIFLGTTYDSGDTNGSPPSISGVDYTTYGNEVRGTSGYVILYGSNFTTPFWSTSGSASFGSPAYLSATQINLYYSIPLDTDSGTYSNDIGVSTPYGSGAVDFYVDDPTPSITSMSSSDWNAGSVYTGFTIYGSGFGSSPSVSFSDGYISFSPSSAGDTSITGTLTIGSSDPGGSVTVTVNADGYGGSSFIAQAGGGSGAVTSSGIVRPLPHISSISPGNAFLGQTTTITISGSNFGSSCPTFNWPTGMITTGTPSCSGSSISVSVIPQFGSAVLGYDSFTLTTSVGTGNSATILINGPNSMKVLTDEVNPLTGKRDTRYQVLDYESQPAIDGMHLAEAFSVTSWSCTTLSGTSNTTPPGTGSNACDDTAVTNIYYDGASIPHSGAFIDYWSFESTNYGPTGCGYEGISDYWQWCGNSTGFTVQDPTTSTAISIGHLYGYSHTNAVSIEGVALSAGFSGTSALIGTLIFPSSNP